MGYSAPDHGRRRHEPHPDNHHFRIDARGLRGHLQQISYAEGCRCPSAGDCWLQSQMDRKTI